MILLFLMVVAAQAISRCADPPDPTEQPWKSGETSVTLSSDGTLRVSGIGAMEDYSYDPRCGIQSPWNNATWWRYSKKLYNVKIKITDVVIEDGVTHIGNFAFSWLRNLKSVTIPASVTSIGEGAFQGSRQPSINVAADNAYYSSEDGILFDKNKTILILYPRDKQDDDYTIPSSVTEIGKNAFSNCFRLTSVTIPGSVKTIGQGAFAHCLGLTSVTFEDGLISIGDEAFTHCFSLTSVTIPSSVTNIGIRAFQRCRSLTSITIPSRVVNIGSEAFDDCTDLASITIEDGVTSIGKYTFASCTSLMSITIPKSVMSIGDDAFSGCKNLTAIFVQNPKPPEVGSNVFDNINWDHVYLYVPAKSIKAYRQADGWSDFNSINAYNMKGIPWLTLTVLTALLLSTVIFVIIKKSGKRRTKGIAVWL